jgi:phytoene/squalene synthetase
VGRSFIGRPLQPLRSGLFADADTGLMNEHSDLVPYCGRVAAGLVACGVLAVTLHAYVAAEAIVAAVIITVVTLGSVMLGRDGKL